MKCIFCEQDVVIESSSIKGICRKCFVDLDRLSRLLFDSMAGHSREDHAFIVHMLKICKEHHEQNKYVPEWVFNKAASTLQLNYCLQCGRSGVKLNKYLRTICDDCYKRYRGYTDALRRLRRAEATGAPDNRILHIRDTLAEYEAVYIRRMRRGLQVPNQFRERMGKERMAKMKGLV